MSKVIVQSALVLIVNLTRLMISPNLAEESEDLCIHSVIEFDDSEISSVLSQQPPPELY